MFEPYGAGSRPPRQRPMGAFQWISNRVSPSRCETRFEVMKHRGLNVERRRCATRTCDRMLKSCWEPGAWLSHAKWPPGPFITDPVFDQAGSRCVQGHRDASALSSAALAELLDEDDHQQDRHHREHDSAHVVHVSPLVWTRSGLRIRFGSAPREMCGRDRSCQRPA
jgi:hypothetical protein